MEVLRLEVTICDLKQKTFDSICVTEVVMCSASPFANSRDAGLYPSLRVLVLRQPHCSGDSAVCLAPFMWRDVHRAVLQVGRTVFERGRLCQ